MQYVATIGFFDGVHSGHQYLLRYVTQIALQKRLNSAVVTFLDSPKNYFNATATPLLTTTSERCQLIEQQGISKIFLYSFALIAKMTAVQFLSELYKNGVRVLIMGFNHHFGADGKTANYTRLGQQMGIEIIKYDEYLAVEKISSTHIRTLIASREIEKANQLLGYAYFLNGIVVHGRGIGNTFGFPTANIVVDNGKMIPPIGVYAVKMKHPFNALGVMNIGNNPTFGNSETTEEVHFIDFNENLYNQNITVELLHFIREEKKFSSPEELYSQVQSDIDFVKCHFGRH